MKGNQKEVRAGLGDRVMSEQCASSIISLNATFFLLRWVHVVQVGLKLVGSNDF